MEKRRVIIDQGAPEWMVTFGDMMTLLLIFFILLFSVSKLKDAGKVYDMIYALQGMMTGNRPVHGYLLPNYNAIIDDLRNQEEGERRHFGEGGVHPERKLHPEGDSFFSLRARDHLKIVVEGKVLFEEGSSAILQEGKEALERLLVPRFQGGPFRIIIRGHVAPKEAPTPEGEDDLGFGRAREVRDLFVSKGIASSRFELQTMGSRLARPGAEGDTPEGRRKLRKVEIFVSPLASGMPIE
jgi:chemotaxis protein MotB